MTTKRWWCYDEFLNMEYQDKEYMGKILDSKEYRMYLSDITNNHLEEEEIMAEKEKSMVERILDTERAGYAYFYPSDGGSRQDFFISTTPENMANFLGALLTPARIRNCVQRLFLTLHQFRWEKRKPGKS